MTIKRVWHILFGHDRVWGWESSRREGNKVICSKLKCSCESTIMKMKRVKRE